MKEPRVKEVIWKYKNGNLLAVHDYLNDPNMVVDPSTWSGQIKQMIEKRQFVTAKQLIEMIAYKFINSENYDKK